MVSHKIQDLPRIVISFKANRFGELMLPDPRIDGPRVAPKFSKGRKGN